MQREKVTVTDRPSERQSANAFPLRRCPLKDGYGSKLMGHALALYLVSARTRGWPRSLDKTKWKQENHIMSNQIKEYFLIFLEFSKRLCILCIGFHPPRLKYFPDSVYITFDIRSLWNWNDWPKDNRMKVNPRIIIPYKTSLNWWTLK